MQDKFSFDKEIIKMQDLGSRIKKDYSKGYIYYGENNLEPQRLVLIYNQHSEHRAIINRKVRYLFGKGVYCKDASHQQIFEQFNKSFNSKETFEKSTGKIGLNFELFNSLFIEVITNPLGEILSYSLLSSAKCRLDEKGETLFYTENWRKNYTPKDKIVEIPKFEKGIAGRSFLTLKSFNASAFEYDNVYPLPTYFSAVDEILTDLSVSKFNKNYVEKGFSVGTVINFFNGEPTPHEIEKNNTAFKGTYTGSDGESVMITYNDRDAKEPTVLTVGIDDIDKKYEATSKRILQKIFVAHEAMPELFNVKFDNSVFSAGADLAQLQNIFINGYIVPRRNEILEFIEYLIFLKYNMQVVLSVDDIDLINIGNALPNGETPIEATAVNSTLTNLTGRQFQGLNRIVKQYDKGAINKQSAIAMLSSGFGLTEEEAITFLNENDADVSNDNLKMSKVETALMLFEKHAKPDIEEDEVIEVKLAHIHNSMDALKLEREVMKFANELVVSVEELDNAILLALRGNPTLSVEELALQLNQNVLTVSESVARLVKNKLIAVDGTSFIPTEKGSVKEIPANEVYEVYTVYKYALNLDKPALKEGGKSRKFCSDLMALSRKNSWDFETIDSMTNELGTNAWDYRGGYYTNPDTGETDPDCRHIWNAVIKRRKVKK